jgi:hypothetical protein
MANEQVGRDAQVPISPTVSITTVTATTVTVANVTIAESRRRGRWS